MTARPIKFLWRFRYIITVVFASLLFHSRWISFGADGFVHVQHDQYFFVTTQSYLLALSLFSNENMLSPNGIDLLTNGLNAVFSILLLKFGFSLSLVLQLTKAMCLIGSGLVLFSGLHHLNGKERPGLSALITFFILSSPFFLMNYEIGVFWSFATAACFSLVPLQFHLLNNLFRVTTNLEIKRFFTFLVISLLPAFLSLGYLIPIAMLLILWTAVCTEITWIKLRRVVTVCWPIFVAWLTTLSPVFYSIFIHVYDFGMDSVGSVYDTAGLGLINFGFFAPLFQVHSWAQFQSIGSLFGGFRAHLGLSLLINGVSLLSIIYLLLPFRTDKVIRFALLGILSGAFFAKGISGEFSLVFSWLFENFPPFSLVRSPDTKFGLMIIIGIALTLNQCLSLHLRIWHSCTLRRKIVTFVAIIFAFGLSANGLALSTGLLKSDDIHINSGLQIYPSGFEPTRALIEACSFLSNSKNTFFTVLEEKGGWYSSNDGIRFLIKSPISRCLTLPYFHSTNERRRFSDLASSQDASLILAFLETVYVVEKQRYGTPLKSVRPTDVIFENDEFKIYRDTVMPSASSQQLKSLRRLWFGYEYISYSAETLDAFKGMVPSKHFILTSYCKDKRESSRDLVGLAIFHLFASKSFDEKHCVNYAVFKPNLVLILTLIVAVASLSFMLQTLRLKTGTPHSE